MRRPWRITGGWHTETHDPHAHHHHESSNRLFSAFFYEAVVQHVTYVTDFCRVGRVVYPSWRTTPRNFQVSNTGVVAQSSAATCQITRKDGTIIGILYGGFWFALFSLHARGSSLRQHSKQQARSSVLTITVRFVR